jgi:hypothetical protein
VNLVEVGRGRARRWGDSGGTYRSSRDRPDCQACRLGFHVRHDQGLAEDKAKRPLSSLADKSAATTPAGARAGLAVHDGQFGRSLGSLRVAEVTPSQPAVGGFLALH